MGFHAGCRVKSQRFGKFCKSSGKYKPKTYKLKLVLHRKLTGGSVVGDVVHPNKTPIVFGSGGGAGTVDSHKNHTSVNDCFISGVLETFEKSTLEIFVNGREIFEKYLEHVYKETIECLSDKKTIIINNIVYYSEVVAITQVV
jgi:hypothetical protein